MIFYDIGGIDIKNRQIKQVLHPPTCNAGYTGGAGESCVGAVLRYYCCNITHYHAYVITFFVTVSRLIPNVIFLNVLIYSETVDALCVTMFLLTRRAHFT